MGDESDDVKRRKRSIAWSKALMLVVLAIAATVSTIETHRRLFEVERRAVENKVREYKNEIFSLSRSRLISISSDANDLARTSTSYAISTGKRYPFVLLPHFLERTNGMVENLQSDHVCTIVDIEESDRIEWEKFSLENRNWMVNKYNNITDDQYELSPVILDVQADGGVGPATPEDGRLYSVAYQCNPVYPTHINLNGFSVPPFPPLHKAVNDQRSIILGPLTYTLSKRDVELSWPTSSIAVPIFSQLDQVSTIAGMVTVAISWHRLLGNILSPGSDKIIVSIVDSCGDAGSISYSVEGPKAKFLSAGTRNDPRTDPYRLSSPFDILSDSINSDEEQSCGYTIEVAPTVELLQKSFTKQPILYGCIVGSIFLFATLVFVLYDRLVERRQIVMVHTAERTGALVDSIFPKNVRDRLLEQGTKTNGKPKLDLTVVSLATKPIADLFPDASIMFANISSFTSWSSTRQPDQVFVLLEQLYSAFDILAKRHNIFKVETVADSYVAACGLPHARQDHAVAIVKFAMDCLAVTTKVVNGLEVMLGPDTSDLDVRIGINSGQITGGVLRGAKARFQLFGDAVNTASRIESSGANGRIHISRSTADRLRGAGKENWCCKRDDVVTVKGKGTIETYWIVSDSPSHEKNSTDKIQRVGDNRNARNEKEPSQYFNGTISKRQQRLEAWVVDVLLRQLKQVVAMRGNDGTIQSNYIKLQSALPTIANTNSAMVLDEVKEIIHLPGVAKKYQRDPDTVDLGTKVLAQLQQYVSTIAGWYNDNAFHCFEHATHVTQSVIKLLDRIVAKGGNADFNDLTYKHSQNQAAMHDHTFGITSDPVIQFACSFSSLIHDAGHTGISNAVLVKEKTDLAIKYRNKSVAEQNSVDIAWNELMKDDYADLRACIYSTQAEHDRFRQLVVNSVMATDIVDKELGQARKDRWAKAFNNGSARMNDLIESQLDATNRKATIVIEHIIQASDVAHTMQHWHVYIKWNEKLFHELYKAHQQDRGAFDPSKGWYAGELGFFDHYIIPLANKLKECGVFGVSSEEYLQYAVQNRAEWERKGHDIVAKYMSKYEENRGD